MQNGREQRPGGVVLEYTRTEWTATCRRAGNRDLGELWWSMPVLNGPLHG